MDTRTTVPAVARPWRPARLRAAAENRLRTALLALSCLTVACGDEAPGVPPAGAPVATPQRWGSRDGADETRDAVAAEQTEDHATWAASLTQRAAPPEAVTRCAPCHPAAVSTFLDTHGMANTLGPLGKLPPSDITLPSSDLRIRIQPDDRLLLGTRPDGGQRRQLLVGRLGAGVRDASLITTELLPAGPLVTTGRLFFAPVEYTTEHGWVLAPFESFHSTSGRDGQRQAGAGLDLGMSAECLGCHTETNVRSLRGAGVARNRDGERIPDGAVYPSHQLGADAFTQLTPLDCGTCHGPVDEHVRLMKLPAAIDPAVPASLRELGLRRWRELPVSERRDRCARCHLEGEARIDLAGLEGGLPAPGTALLGARPVLVPAHPDQDYRFVSQVDRLALSACFQQSPDMTCVSCHVPHGGVARQGTASFDRACMRCHDGGADCVRPTDLGVPDVTGGPARTSQGCVDCHVRRSQPFDLAAVTTADHWVRRTPPPPRAAKPRAWHEAGGALKVFRDEALARELDTEAGRRWETGLIALGLAKQQRFAESARLFESFGAPGTAAALGAEPLSGVTPLATSPSFHLVRGQVLEAVGDADAALAAYGDALALDPGSVEARLNRATLQLERGQGNEALADAAFVLARHPNAEKAWNLRARAAALAGDLSAAAEALRRSAALWPSDPAVHHELGRLLLRLGDADGAHDALRRAATLAPSRPGLAEDLAGVHLQQGP